jgi:hypothetical protein
MAYRQYLRLSFLTTLALDVEKEAARAQTDEERELLKQAAAFLERAAAVVRRSVP